MTSVFWQGVLPWLAAVVGGGLASLFSWLSVWTRYRGALAFHIDPGEDARTAEAKAKAKLESLGKFEPQFRLALWQASVQPLFLFALLFPLGKPLSTDGPQLAICIFMAVVALIVSLLHEFRWKEHVPTGETLLRPIVVGSLWVAMLVLAIWVAGTPVQAKQATAPTPAGSASGGAK